MNWTGHFVGGLCSVWRQSRRRPLVGNLLHGTKLGAEVEGPRFVDIGLLDRYSFEPLDELSLRAGVNFGIIAVWIRHSHRIRHSWINTRRTRGGWIGSDLPEQFLDGQISFLLGE